MLVSVHVEKNGQTLGYRQVKCESRMRELDQILRSCDNPLEFMCQVCDYWYVIASMWLLVCDCWYVIVEFCWCRTPFRCIWGMQSCSPIWGTVIQSCPHTCWFSIWGFNYPRFMAGQKNLKTKVINSSEFSSACQVRTGHNMAKYSSPNAPNKWLIFLCLCTNASLQRLRWSSG
jgi:hypothetical protein